MVLHIDLALGLTAAGSPDITYRYTVLYYTKAFLTCYFICELHVLQATTMCNAIPSSIFLLSFFLH